MVENGYMDPGDIARFARRDWTLLQESKSAYWKQATPAMALQAAYELWAYVRSIRPDWPSEADRAEDMAAHERMVKVWQRVAEHRSR